MALIHYRVGKRDANAIERDLRLWFVRLVQRVNNSLTPVSAFRKYLLLATCEFAYTYQARNLEAQAKDPRLREILARSPRTVAAELQKMLE
jgi:hypothetical protein